MDLGHSFAGGAMGELITNYEGPFLAELILSSHPLITGPSDVPANRQIPGALRTGGVVTRRIDTSTGLYAGLVETTVGEISIANGTGEFDHYLDWKADGHYLKILVGEATRDPRGSFRSPLLADMHTAIEVTAGGWSADPEALRLNVRDVGITLQRRLSQNSYRGTGHAEGPDTLKGVSKPLVIGGVRNVEPVLIEAGTLIYQVHDGRLASFLGVYDSGALVPVSGLRTTYGSLRDARVDPGTAIVAPAIGMVKLGTIPAGRVTVDAVTTGAGSLPIYSPFSDGQTFTDGTQFYFDATPGGVIKNLLLSYGGVPSSRIDHQSFADFDAIQPTMIGYYIEAGQEVTAEQVLVDLARGAGAVVSQSQTGIYFIRQIDAPENYSPIRTFTEAEYVSIRRETPVYGTPWRELIVGYQKNWTVMTADEIVPAVPEQRKVYLTSGGQRRVEYNSSVAGAHLSSRTLNLQSYFWTELEARKEAGRLSRLYSVGRAEYVLIMKKALFALDIGDVVELRLPRFGLDLGKNFVVVACTDDPERDETEVRLFG